MSSTNTNSGSSPARVVLLILGVVIIAVGAFFLGRRSHDSADTMQQASGAAASALQEREVLYWQAPMVPDEIYDKPGKSLMGMDLVPVYADDPSVGSEGSVQIDPVTLQNIGVRTAPVETMPLNREIRTTGRFVMDERGEHTVSLKVAGWVEKLYADFDGMRVNAGEPLLELYSPDLVTTQQEYLLAIKNLERLSGTSNADDARRLVESARMRLDYWDLSAEQIAALELSGEPRKTLTYFAPATGEIMHKDVSVGQYVKAGAALMDIVDLSNTWLIVDVFEQDLAWVNIGTRARFELPNQPGTDRLGRVDYIYHMLDPATRAARARVTVAGGHHAQMKPGMYATVILEGKPTEIGPTVPEEAVIRTGESSVVVIALGGGRFRPVPVRTGIGSNGRVQILSGLRGDEEVVTSAQFLIDSEARLQSAIGAMLGGDFGASTSTTDDAPVQIEDSLPMNGMQMDDKPKDGMPIPTDVPESVSKPDSLSTQHHHGSIELLDVIDPKILSSNSSATDHA